MVQVKVQDDIKEISEQSKIHLRDKQLEAIISLLTDIIDSSFATTVIQLVSTSTGDCTEVNSN